MTPLEGRSCGTCSLCCKVMAIGELNKPQDVCCDHMVRGGGCAIYRSRPRECQAFMCQWLVNPRMGSEWKPDLCGMVVVGEGREKLVVHVGAGSSGPWREPYFSWLRRVSALGLKYGGLVLVMDKGRTTVVLPDYCEEVGVVGEDDRIVVAEVARNGLPRWDVMVMKKDEAEQFAASAGKNTVPNTGSQKG